MAAAVVSRVPDILLVLDLLPSVIYCLALFNKPQFARLDSSGPMSAAHSQPAHMGGMVGHPSVINTSRPLLSPMSTLGSPMNGLASPYSVITSSLGSPSVSLPTTPNMNFGPLHSPQVRTCVWLIRSIIRVQLFHEEYVGFLFNMMALTKKSSFLKCV